MENLRMRRHFCEGGQPPRPPAKKYMIVFLRQRARARRGRPAKRAAHEREEHLANYS